MFPYFAVENTEGFLVNLIKNPSIYFLFSIAFIDEIILKQLVEVTKETNTNSERNVVLWSAGNAGFSSSSEETKKELVLL